MKKKDKKKLRKLAKKEEKLLRKSQAETTAAIPEEFREVANKLQYITGRLNNIGTYKDPTHAFFLLNELKNTLGSAINSKSFKDEATAKSFGMIGVTDVFGYRPQGTQFWNLFPNPFGIFSFLAENHWAVRCCRSEYFKEVLADGYQLIGPKASKERVQRILDNMDFDMKRMEWVDHCKIFGNFWVLPDKNGLGGLKGFKTLLPQYIRPILSVDAQRVLGWEYQLGYGFLRFDKKDLLHQIYRPSMRHYQIGSPALGALLQELEADIQAGMYNNLVFQKGGLLGMAILLNDPKGPTVGGGLSAFAKSLQMEMNANHSGARAGFDTVVLENTKDVKVLNDLGNMDGAFHKTSEKVAKQVCRVLDIPYARVQDNSNSKKIYDAAKLQDQDAELFDKAVNEVVNVVDRFINTVLFPMMGIKDVKIRARRRFNTFTAAAAKAGVDISMIFGAMTLDEMREEIWKLPPHADEAMGKMIATHNQFVYPKQTVAQGPATNPISGATTQPEAELLLPPDSVVPPYISDPYNNDENSDGEDDD